MALTNAIDTHSRRCQAFPHYFVVKAGLRFALGCADPVEVFGYSCDSDAARAELVARCETIERLYTSPEFQEIRAHQIQTFRWPEFTPMRRQVLEGRVVICGSAFRPSQGDAVFAAVSELRERYVLRRLWRTLWPALQPISAATAAPAGIRLNNYRVLGTRILVTAIIDLGRQIFVCGSALRDDESEAALHATAEVIMLHDALLNGDVPRYRSRKSRDAFRALRSSESNARQVRFEQIILPTGCSEHQPTSADLLPSDNDILVHVLYESRTGCVALAEAPYPMDEGSVAEPLTSPFR